MDREDVINAIIHDLNKIIILEENYLNDEEYEDARKRYKNITEYLKENLK